MVSFLGRTQRALTAVFALMFSTLSCLAQAPQPTAGGTLSGHVVFADNDHPARFATLYLKLVDPPSPQDDFFTVLMESAITNMQGKQGSSGEDAAKSLQAARTAAGNLLTSVTDSMLSATIANDGAYTITGVPPGTYYLHVKAPGYVDSLAQFTQQDLTSPDPAVRKHILATVETITITGQEHVRQDLRLERGATLAGRLLYDDGSPAPGWTVTALLKRNAAAGPPPGILGIDLAKYPSARSSTTPSPTTLAASASPASPPANTLSKPPCSPPRSTASPSHPSLPRQARSSPSSAAFQK